jgi:broad specificity phosphatase PhoE
MKLYIIRHGQSTNNALLNQQDRVRDPDLTELGRQQAELVAQHLATGADPEYVLGVSAEDTSGDYLHRYNISRLYCSAMYRALLTAKPIGEALGLAPEVWIDIHEHGGIFLEHQDERGVRGYPGKNRSEILAEFPTYVLPDGVTDEGWWNPANGREDRPACLGRAIRVARTLRRRAVDNGGNIALVSHGGFIDGLLKAFTNQLPGADLFYHHYNTSITRVDLRPDGRVDIRYHNRFDHLPQELVS